MSRETMLEQVALTEHCDEIWDQGLECRVVGVDGLEAYHCSFDLG